MSYRPSAKNGKILQKKGAKNILPTVFIPEQAEVIQLLIDRLDKLEKLVAKQKKQVAEMKGQYNEVFSRHRIT